MAPGNAAATSSWAATSAGDAAAPLDDVDPPSERAPAAAVSAHAGYVRASGVHGLVRQAPLPASKTDRRSKLRERLSSLGGGGSNGGLPMAATRSHYWLSNGCGTCCAISQNRVNM